MFGEAMRVPSEEWECDGQIPGASVGRPEPQLACRNRQFHIVGTGPMQVQSMCTRPQCRKVDTLPVRAFTDATAGAAAGGTKAQAMFNEVQRGQPQPIPNAPPGLYVCDRMVQRGGVFAVCSGYAWGILDSGGEVKIRCIACGCLEPLGFLASSK